MVYPGESSCTQHVCLCLCVCSTLCWFVIQMSLCFSSIWGTFGVCCLILYSVMVGCMVRMCKCWDAVFSNCMVAIALVAESLSFVIEFLGCVMAIFYRIWARAVSTSWRGALHQLYTRPFWHEWNVYCCVSATAPATAATASASGDDHTEKLWTSSYLNAPSCHGYLLSNIHKDIVKLVKVMRDICFSCPGARMQSNDLWRPCMFRQTWECISIKIHLSGAPLNSDPPAKRRRFQNWCLCGFVILYLHRFAAGLYFRSIWHTVMSKPLTYSLNVLEEHGTLWGGEQWMLLRP